MRGAIRGAALAATFALASCTVGPDYNAPETTAPAAWGEATTAGEGLPSAGAPAVAEWWTTFHDAVLDALVDRAVKANPELRRAQARVREARALRGVASADLFPTVDAKGRVVRSRTSENLGFNLPGTHTSTLYEAGFDAAWELDLFGGVRRTVEAADADVAAAVEDRRDVMVSLLAEVARNYVELRGAQRQAAIARQNLAAQRETLDLTQQRLDAGMASDLDIARSQAQVQTTAAEIPSLDSAARRAIHALSVLVDEPPNALSGELSTEAPIPAPPADIPIGLPSELLRRRPDVRRAERRLAAATARIGVATADLFPRFSLTGFLGHQSVGGNPADFLEAGSRIASFGPSVRFPLLDFGRVRSSIDARNAVEEQAAADYEQTVLTSLREVEDAIVTYVQERVRRTALAAAADANKRAVDLALQLNRQGRTDFLSVLDAQRELFASQDALVRSERAVSADLVALYKALGGGWEVEERAGDGPDRGEAGRRVLDLGGPRSSTEAEERR